MTTCDVDRQEPLTNANYFLDANATILSLGF